MNDFFAQAQKNLATLYPDFAKSQEVVQENFKKAQTEFEAQAKKAQANLQDLQKAMVQSPSFEFQKVLMSQYLDLIKQVNRQTEGQIEQLFSQLNTAATKFEEATKAKK